MDHEKLTAAGLTGTEAKLYSALVDLGKAQAGTLSRKTGIHRRSVYDALERLIEKGLVSFIKENDKRFYLAEHPQRLLQLIDHQRNAVQEVVPALEQAYKSRREKQETRFYRGIEGIKRILDDQLSEGEEVMIIGAAKNARDVLKWYLERYTRSRVEQHIPLKLIYFGKKQRLDIIPESELRHLPEEHGGDVSTNIWGDKIALITWSDEPIAILIKNEKVADSYRKLFSLLWGIAK